MLVYLFQLSVLWIIGWLLYYIFLSKETFHQWNRIYLLSVIALGIILPFIEINTPIANMPSFLLSELVVTANAFEPNVNPIIITAIEGWSWWEGSYILYGIGVLISCSFFFKEIIHLYQLKRKSFTETHSEYTWIQANIPSPFSFFNFLFWKERPDPQNTTHQYILRHELAHIRQGHSFDKLFLQILSILLWWHPMVYIFKHFLSQLHEYLADEAAILKGNKKQYGQLLLSFSKPKTITFPLSNTLIQSPIKSRILMLLQPISPLQNRWKYLLISPLMAFVFFACQPENESITKEKIPAEINSYKNDEWSHLEKDYLTDTIITFDAKTYTETVQVVKTPFYKEVDQMPVFGDCPGLSGEELKRCGDNALLQFIYNNIKYPEAARKAEIEGTALARFVVQSDGYLRDIKIVRSVSPEIDAEVLRVINSSPKWQHAGMKDGKQVNVQFNLPIKFKLE